MYKNIINFIQFYIQNFTKAKLDKNKTTLIINIKVLNTSIFKNINLYIFISK